MWVFSCGIRSFTWLDPVRNSLLPKDSLQWSLSCYLRYIRCRYLALRKVFPEGSLISTVQFIEQFFCTLKLNYFNNNVLFYYAANKKKVQMIYTLHYSLSSIHTFHFVVFIISSISTVSTIIISFNLQNIILCRSLYNPLYNLT